MRGPIAGAALAVGAAACGGTPPPPASAPEAAVPPSPAPTGKAAGSDGPVILPSDANVVEQATAALNAGDFDCKPMDSEQGVAACDVEKDGVPSLVLVYGTPVLFALSHFLRKPGVECESILPKLNEINGAVDRMKLVCIENRVSFMTMISVPSSGLAPVDVREAAMWFRNTVQMVLATSGLVGSLQ